VTAVTYYQIHHTNKQGKEGKPALHHHQARASTLHRLTLINTGHGTLVRMRLKSLKDTKYIWKEERKRG